MAQTKNFKTIAILVGIVIVAVVAVILISTSLKKLDSDEGGWSDHLLH